MALKVWLWNELKAENMNLSNFRIGVKLGLISAILVVLTLAIGRFGLRQLVSINATTEDMFYNWLANIKQLGDIREPLPDTR
jgi:hypothetical protein